MPPAPAWAVRADFLTVGFPTDIARARVGRILRDLR